MLFFVCNKDRLPPMNDILVPLSIAQHQELEKESLWLLSIAHRRGCLQSRYLTSPCDLWKVNSGGTQLWDGTFVHNPQRRWKFSLSFLVSLESELDAADGPFPSSFEVRE